MIQTDECSIFLRHVYSRNFQETVRFLWQPKCYYLLHNVPNRQMHPIQSQLNLVATVMYYFPSIARLFPSSFPTKIPKVFVISHMIATYLIHPMPLDLMMSQCLVNNTFYDALRRLQFTSCYLGAVFCLAVCSDTRSVLDSQSVLRHSVCSETLSVLRYSVVCSQTLSLPSDTQSVLRQHVCSQILGLF